MENELFRSTYESSTVSLFNVPGSYTSDKSKLMMIDHVVEVIYIYILIIEIEQQHTFRMTPKETWKFSDSCNI